MFKLLVVASITSLVLATTAEDFYRTWYVVANVPGSANVTSCSQVIFDKYLGNSECSCDGGKKATLVNYSGVVKDENQNRKVEGGLMSMITIDTPDHRGVNVNCTCDGKTFKSAMVVRLLNPEYFVMMYEVLMSDPAPHLHRSSVSLLAKHIPTLAELNDTILNTVEMKNLNVNWKCASDL